MVILNYKNLPVNKKLLFYKNETPFSMKNFYEKIVKTLFLLFFLNISIIRLASISAL